MDEPSVKDRLALILANLEETRLAYLFGSQAEGMAGPTSDYDLGVLIDRSADASQTQAQLAHQMAQALGTDRVDIVILNQAPIELAYAIIAQGTLLFEQDVATRVDYEARVLGLYSDYLPVLRAQRDDILRGDDHERRVQRYREAFRRTERTLGQIAVAQAKGQD